MGTENKTFSRFNPRIISTGIEIKATDLNELIERLENAGFKKEVNKVNY